MGKIIYSFCKDGVRYDRPQEEITKQEPIASDNPVISRGAIVTSKGHKGKVLDVTGDKATISWEDASISEVPIADLKYEGRVEKGGPGSGVYERGEGKGGYPKEEVKEPRNAKEAGRMIRDAYKDKVPAGVRSRMARIKEGAEQRMKARDGVKDKYSGKTGMGRFKTPFNQPPHISARSAVRGPRSKVPWTGTEGAKF